MKGLNLKNAAKLLNLLVTYQLAFSPLHAIAQDAKQGGGAVDILNGLMGAAAGVTGQMAQQQQQQQQMMQQQSMIQAIIPQTYQDDIFPACKILPAKNNHLANLCTEPINGPQDQQMILQYLAIAQQNSNSYKNFMTTGLKMGNNTGKQCFDEQNKLLQAQLDQRAKAIQVLIAQIENENQVIEKETKARMDAIKDLTAELDGTDGATRDGKARDFSVFLNDKACGQVLAQQRLSPGDGAIGGGLRGVRNEIKKNIDGANKIITNKEAIEKDIRSQVSGLTKYLKQQGAQALKTLDKGFASVPNMPSSDYFANKSAFSEGLTSKLADYKQNLSDIETEMKRFSGIDFQEKIKNGSSVASLKKDIKVQLDTTKKNSLKSCAFDEGTGISRDVLGSNLEQIRTNSAGTTTSSFKAKLNAIISGNSTSKSLDALIADIEKLEGQYGYKEVTLKINNSYDGKNAKYDWSPSELLKTVQKSCETRFSTEKLDEYGGLTMNEVFSQSYATLNKYEKLETEMTNQLTTAVLDRALNCAGVTTQVSAETCGSGNMLSPDNANFCMKNATACAVSVQSCYALADNVIKTKENQRLAVAKDHNLILKNQMMKHDLTLKNIAGQFMTQSQMLKGFFPGSTFELPEGENAFLVEIPKEEMNSEFGVPLINAESYKKQIITKLGKVKDKIKEQNESIKGMVDNRLATLEAAYTEEAAYWDKLAGDCTALNNNYKQQQAQALADQQKAQQEEQKALGEFCYNANTFSAKPGCDDQVEDLSSSGQKVANRLTANDQKKLQKLAAYCRDASPSNEGTEVTKKTVYYWCKKSKASDCSDLSTAYDNAYKQLENSNTSTTPTGGTTKTPPTEEQVLNAIAGAKFDPVFDSYYDSLGGKGTDSDLGEKPTYFAACHTVNGSGTNKSGDPVNDFLKMFGGTTSVQN